MAYVKQNWQCGEMITADKLNHMEDGIAAGGDCDCGFECEESFVTLTNETVTTVAGEGGNEGQFSYSQLIDADTIKVTFNGTEYECPHLADNQISYGAPYDDSTHSFDWSEYPFQVSSLQQLGGSINHLVTQTAGTYSIKIEGMFEKVTTTPCFDKAVRSATTAYAHITSTMGDDGCAIMTLDITDEDLASIISNGQQLAIVDETSHHIIYPTDVYASDATVAHEEQQRVIQPGYPLGHPTAAVTIAITADNSKEYLATLYAYDGTASPRYLTGRLCMGDTGKMYVNLTYDSAQDKLIADKTHSEAKAAIENGTNVIFKYNGLETSYAKVQGTDIISWGFTTNGNVFDYFGYRFDALERISEI